jgi:hypothetical protein
MELDPGEFAGWVSAFAFTQVVEVPIYVGALGLGGRRLAARKLGLLARLCVAFSCSLLTHPVVWFVFPRLIDAYYHYVAMVIAAETFAVLTEAAVVAVALGGGARSVAPAFLISLLANMTSMSLGFLVRYFFGWF